MRYISTRGNYHAVTSAEAIALGMVPEGGLFVPEEFPVLSADQIQDLVGKSYQEIATFVLSLFLEDYRHEEIASMVAAAYGTNFDQSDIAPLVKLGEREYILELWHGPTAAFKDMALQLTPRLMVQAAQQLQLKNEIVVLVATSGDTGKAALEGFKNVPGTKIIVFYPAHGVSKVQELQMTTTDGENTYVVGVEGNFDDCQSAVKEIFADKELAVKMAAVGYQFSSANSINWGRLLPQIVYYVASYVRLLSEKAISYGEQVDFVVPTGNFGNILAGWYARRMGVPVGTLVCASNKNQVLTDFLQTGTYDRQRAFYQTNSPSMDILISSNLERFLFAMTDSNGTQVAQWMDDLKLKGAFTVDAATKEKIAGFVTGGTADEEETLQMIRTCYEKHQYLLDTHTAVAMQVSHAYQKQNPERHVIVIDSTAHPCKFVSSVYQALYPENQIKNEMELLEKLIALPNVQQHPGLQNLDKRPVKHQEICEKTQIAEKVKEILQLT